MNKRKGTVFLVDDDADTRASLEEALEEIGFIVLPARHGREAIARMKGCLPPAIAIVDLVMPDMDGWSLIQRMKSDRDLQKIPVIVLSGKVLQAHVEGAARVFEKPFQLDEVLRTVEKLCVL